MIDHLTRPEAARIHSRHCDASDKHDPDHVCQGTITIRAAFVAFECPRCGEEQCDLREQMNELREQKRIAMVDEEQYRIRTIARLEAMNLGADYFQPGGYYG